MSHRYQNCPKWSSGMRQWHEEERWPTPPIQPQPVNWNKESLSQQVEVIRFKILIATDAVGTYNSEYRRFSLKKPLNQTFESFKETLGKSLKIDVQEARITYTDAENDSCFITNEDEYEDFIQFHVNAMQNGSTVHMNVDCTTYTSKLAESGSSSNKPSFGETNENEINPMLLQSMKSMLDSYMKEKLEEKEEEAEKQRKESIIALREERQKMELILKEHEEAEAKQEELRRENKRKAEAEAMKRAIEEERKRKAEEERMLAIKREELFLAEKMEQERILAEKRQKEELERKRIEDIRRAQREAEEKKRKAEAEAMRRAIEEERKRKAEEEAMKIAIEEERKRKAEEERAAKELKNKLEEDIRRAQREEEEKKRKAEAEAMKRAIEEERKRKAEEEQREKNTEEAKYAKHLEILKHMGFMIETQEMIRLLDQYKGNMQDVVNAILSSPHN